MGFWSQRFEIPEKEKEGVIHALSEKALSVGLRTSLFSKRDVSVKFYTPDNVVELTVSLPPDREAYLTFTQRMKEHLKTDPIEMECIPIMAELGAEDPKPEKIRASFSFLKESKRVTTQEAKGQKVTLAYDYTPALARALGVNTSQQTRER